MHTITEFPLKSAQTRSVAIAASPTAILELLGDGNRLPEWAPAFARRARADGDGGHWLVDSGGVEVRIRIRVSVEFGTVDLLSADDDRLGAFGRVIPNGEGGEFLFTLLFDAGVEQEAIDAQMKTVEAELDTVRRLAEG